MTDEPYRNPYGEPGEPRYGNPNPRETMDQRLRRTASRGQTPAPPKPQEVIVVRPPIDLQETIPVIVGQFLITWWAARKLQKWFPKQFPTFGRAMGFVTLVRGLQVPENSYLIWSKKPLTRKTP